MSEATTSTSLQTDDQADLRYWADVFDVSIDELRFATGLVGTDLDRLREYLENADSWLAGLTVLELDDN